MTKAQNKNSKTEIRMKTKSINTKYLALNTIINKKY